MLEMLKKGYVKNEIDAMSVTGTFSLFQWSSNELGKGDKVSTGTFLHSFGPDFLP